MKDILKVSSSTESAEFYDRLVEGQETRGMLGAQTRFNPVRVSRMPSVRKYFVDVVKPYLDPSQRVLDFGCGPGSFLLPLAPFCREIVGAEISRNFVTQGLAAVQEAGLSNATLVHIQPDQLPFEDASFDTLLLVDVIHHLENIDLTLKEAFRVLKPGGRVLIYEPNKLNPLLALVHLLDRNEWGLLRLGTPWKYRRVLAPFMALEKIEFNGIVIGPQSRIYTLASEALNSPALKPVLGWLNPKMFMTGRKR